MLTPCIQSTFNVSLGIIEIQAHDAEFVHLIFQHQWQQLMRATTDAQLPLILRHRGTLPVQKASR